MDDKPENPPAFPVQWPNASPDTGMSLRDYFAGQAMAGLCANSGGPFQANGMTGWGFTNCDAETVAIVSYSLAEAMLAARKSKPE